MGGMLPESFCEMWSYPFLRRRCLSAVVYLNLSANDLTGPLQPAVFTDLTSLEKLDLSRNQLYGTIPSNTFVYALDHITELHLHNNKLTGVVPEAACGVTKCDMRGNPGLCRPFGLALLLHPTSCCGVQMFCSNTIIAIVVTIALFFILIIVANAVVVVGLSLSLSLTACVLVLVLVPCVFVMVVRAYMACLCVELRVYLVCIYVYVYLCTFRAYMCVFVSLSISVVRVLFGVVGILVLPITHNYPHHVHACMHR